MPAEGLLLRVTQRAWAALGVAAKDRALPGPGESPPRNSFVRTFCSKCATAKALGGTGKPLHDIHPGLYRFSTGAEPRTVVWHDQDGGVVWLCAGLSFPEGDPKHERLYEEVERLARRTELLPSDSEVEIGRAERFWLAVMDELAFALRQAEQEPYNWREARVATTSGRDLEYGAFFVEEITVPGEGGIRARHFLVLRNPPEDVPHPPKWQAIMIAELFPEGGPVRPVYDLSEMPPGAPSLAGAIAMVHEVEMAEPDPYSDDYLLDIE